MSDRIKGRLQRWRSAFEKKFFPDPGVILGQSFYSAFPLEQSQIKNNVVAVEWMTGFRMTFRTTAIRQSGFDINLKRYAVFEDRDASYKAWKSGAVVGARNARIFHFRSPEKRDSGRRMGVEQLLNLAYIIAANSPVNHPARNQLRHFFRYKIFLYRLSAKDNFSRERLQGARAAFREIPAFVRVPAQDAAALYQKAISKCLP